MFVRNEWFVDFDYTDLPLERGSFVKLLQRLARTLATLGAPRKWS
jgi:hypothetical protein